MKKKISDFAIKFKGAQDAQYRDAVGALVRDLVLLTPRASGKTQASWRIGINEQADSSVGSNNAPDARALADQLTGQLKDVSASDSIEIVNNNQPVVRLLEFGGISSQAPQGWVRLTARRWGAYVSENGSKVNI